MKKPDVTCYYLSSAAIHTHRDNLPLPYLMPIHLLHPE